ncbi:MAG: phosphonate C-P lyase system protein PhnL [Spirochaetales bacterium]|nr:phosphonate C-P lyase system protein PhnL [Spirochaetales bacterium]
MKDQIYREAGKKNDMPILEIRNISKSFDLHDLDRHIEACRNVSISVFDGEFVGITGKSGSGKSTVLKLIYRTYLPQDGQILYNSTSFGLIDMYKATERQVIWLRKYEIGYVSQFLHVIPRTTARQIVEKAAIEKGLDRQTVYDRAVQILRHFELPDELWDSYPATFSGGEKLRLNIAQAMVKEPRLLLLDEPTASLDMHSKYKVRELIEQLKRRGTTMLGIFHDLEFMEGLCDREHRMNAGVMETILES